MVDICRRISDNVGNRIGGKSDVFKCRSETIDSSIDS